MNMNEVVSQVNNSEALLIDVRSKGEWSSAHAKGAIHVPAETINGYKVPAEFADKPVYLYCASGARSGAATRVLVARGINAQNIGSLYGWAAGGGEIIR